MIKIKFNLFTGHMIKTCGPAVALLRIGALSYIDVPGLYMDSVNPGDRVVRLLNVEAIMMIIRLRLMD